MNIAIIGAGNVGGALATSAQRAGHSVTVSSKGGDTARKVAEATGARAAGSALEAVENADVVILAVPYPGVADVISEAGAALAGKVVIDATNPLKDDFSGLATEGTSGAEVIQAQAPDALVVKAFNTQFASRQADPSVANGLRVDGYVAADDADAKRLVLELVEGIGFNPVDAGALSMAKYLEAMAFLNISLQVSNGWSWQAGWKLVGPDGDVA